MNDWIAAGVVATIALAFGLAFARSELRRRRLSTHGTATEGRVLSTSNHRNTNVWIGYTDHVGTHHKINVSMSSSRGRTVRVRYDPDRPHHAFVPDARWSHLPLLLGVVLPLGLAGHFLGLW